MSSILSDVAREGGYYYTMADVTTKQLIGMSSMVAATLFSGYVMYINSDVYLINEMKKGLTMSPASLNIITN